jgi:flavin-dependent dehydrogenase
MVAGGGPAGAIAALTLAQAGRSVLLVDDVQPKCRKVGESLPGVVRPLLRSLGLLALVENGPHLPCYGNLSAWGTDELIMADSIHDPHGAGWHLDRPRFDADLREAAQAAGAVWQCDRMQKIVPIDSGWQVYLKDSEVRTHWLIDATGRGAKFARSQGAVRERDHSLVAVCTWCSAPDNDTDTRTYTESIADGWFYTARLPDKTRVVVLHVNAEDAASICRVPEVFGMYVARSLHIRHLLAELALEDTLYLVEACGARLNRFAGNNWLATGDAALSFDPISSQGIFNALYTGMKAGQAVRDALTGRPEAIKAYVNQLEGIRAAYSRHCRSVYQLEQRWLHRSFWARRA